MARLLTSPLFIVLIIVLPLQCFLLCRGWRSGRLLRAVCFVSIAMLVSLALLCIPSTSRVLYGLIENGVTDEFNCPQDVVVVLTGGYHRGAKPSNDRLSGESETRVQQGIEVFKKCSAKWLVLSGRSGRGNDEKREVKLMRDMALRAGVPEERILIEAKSRRTREHPICLKAVDLIGEDSNLAIVTSPWHVRRSLIEFRRIFPKTTAVASYPYSYSSNYTASLADWIPQAQALERSTRPIHEYIGMLWYEFLNLFYATFGANMDACGA